MTDQKAEWHHPARSETRAALENAIAGREPGSDDGDMKSIGEVLSASGWKPHTVVADSERPAEYWQHLVDEDWKIQRPKIWPTMLRNGVPPKFVVEIQSERIRRSMAISTMENWGASNHQMVVLSGDPQVGKSFAAAEWLSRQSKFLRTQFGNEPWLNYRRVLQDYAWVSAPSLAGMKDRFDPEIRAKSKRLEDCSVLVIDEVGGESIGDVSKAVISLLIQRWAFNRRTIMTTNLGRDAFQGEVGDRVFARLRDSGQFVTVGPFDRGVQQNLAGLNP